jgi:hypothetical protein
MTPEPLEAPYTSPGATLTETQFWVGKYRDKRTATTRVVLGRSQSRPVAAAKTLLKCFIAIT